MYLGVEIGGTKLQMAVGDGTGGPFVDFRRQVVDPAQGASGILAQIAATARELARNHPVSCVGIGFGGPVDMIRGRTVKSHQIKGWEDVAIVEWCGRELNLPAVLGNDCDVAALAEASFGSGRGKQRVFYLTVGTGVGGGLVLDGRLQGSGRPAIAEIGHLRPGVSCTSPDQTVESCASGWGIVDRAKSLGFTVPHGPVTGEKVAEAARKGNSLCLSAIAEGVRTLGWAIAQTITLVAPEMVVIGGGVSLIGEELFFRPLVTVVDQYVFPPLRSSYQIVPAALGEEVVVHGALALAAQHHS